MTFLCCVDDKRTFWKIQASCDNTSWFWNSYAVYFFEYADWLVWWVLGASWICIALFNSDFLESRHPLSSHLCVYSDTQSLAHWNQSSWLMMRMWVWVTCMSCTEGVNVSLRTCAFACLTVCVCVWFFSVYFTVLTARSSILVAIGIVISVVSCVSVSSIRLDWPSVALCRATSSLFLWEWQAYTESCPGVTASSQQHNWWTLLIFSTAFPIHELSFLFTKRTGTTKQSHPFYSLFFNFFFFYCFEYVLFYIVKCYLELTCV